MSESFDLKLINAILSGKSRLRGVSDDGGGILFFVHVDLRGNVTCRITPDYNSRLVGFRTRIFNDVSKAASVFFGICASKRLRVICEEVSQ